ncbi:MAG: hypothetical protein K2X52_11865 [Mycobacteriaceae bacterium]|nr:hypothetical protein [Mycobacteriaceae bacterium]
MSTAATPTGPTRAPTSTRRAVLNTSKGSAGNLVEWYDVYVYTVFFGLKNRSETVLDREQGSAWAVPSAVTHK